LAPLFANRFGYGCSFLQCADVGFQGRNLKACLIFFWRAASSMDEKARLVEPQKRLPAASEIHPADDCPRNFIRIGVAKGDECVFPPSSRMVRLTVSEAAFITARPVGTLPISAIMATSG
jgi:hypothetical protein